MAAARTLAILTSDPDGPGVRHRFRAYASALERRGVLLDVVPWPKSGAARREALDRVERADGTVVSSRLLNVRDVGRVRESARRLGFDFDDALPFRDSRRGASRSFTRRRRFAAIVRVADRVTCGNPYLARLAAEQGVEATVLPTAVPVGERPQPALPEKGLPAIGWIGSHATIGYLEERAVVFSALVASGRSYRLRVIADAEPSFPPGVAVEPVRWTEHTWEGALAGVRFGLAPLSDDAWTRGRCGLRLLQTLAVGRPCVASAVGVQSEQVRHGETGWLARDREGFLEGMVELLDDPERCRAMGEAGFEDVRSRWSVAAWTDRVVDAREALLA
ncbi:MAG: glycosyltransferase [Planctomycetes bacterium]|nr:glycosyltransferase [Planctomycetota bacterium]MCB9829450.1 glycosyltransferase [Planctomycetota bacterium]MCB9900172.1 glycosyltransferase [Planctomycetota bacterium]